ncbi:MAG: MFS transporter [Bacteroidetes bacterium]|nr:MFS transporter [Bacteroidota bacterium]
MNTLRRLTADPARTALLVAGGLGFVLIGAAQSLYGPFYGVFRARFDLTATVVSLITTFHFVGATTGLSVSGFLAGRFGPLRVVTGAIFTLALGFLGVAFGTTWPLTLAGATVVGLGFGGLVTMNFLIARVFGAAGPAALNALNAMFGVGSVLAPMAAAPFAARGAHMPVYLAAGALAIALGLYFAFTRRIRVEETPVREREPLPLRSFILPVAGFIVLYFFYMASEASFGNWIPTHLTPAFGAAPAARYAGLFWLALTVGRLAAAPVSLRVTPGVLVSWTIVLGIGAALTATAVSLAPFAYIAAGFFCGPVFPGGLAWMRRRFPDSAEEVSSVVLAVAGLGTVIAPPVIGSAVDAFGVRAIPLGVTGMLILAGVCAHVLRLAGRRRERE